MREKGNDVTSNNLVCAGQRESDYARKECVSLILIRGKARTIVDVRVRILLSTGAGGLLKYVCYL